MEGSLRSARKEGVLLHFPKFLQMLSSTGRLVVDLKTCKSVILVSMTEFRSHFTQYVAYRSLGDLLLLLFCVSGCAESVLLESSSSFNQGVLTEEVRLLFL